MESAYLALASSSGTPTLRSATFQPIQNPRSNLETQKDELETTQNINFVFPETFANSTLLAAVFAILSIGVWSSFVGI